ncbi:MAG TPA: tetratricopeptide repeat protein, partial [Blastocatellia bacterium]|nr:tetratricopeptide repeat protein [Blastocatellia bacterium]
EDLLAEAQQQCLVVAECYLRSGLNEQGFNVYQEIIRRNPDNVDVRNRLAEAYLRHEYRDRAYDVFLDAANVLKDQGRFEEALKSYLRALTAKPEGRGALVAAVNIYLQRGETQPAESLIKYLLRTRPEDPELLTLLGHVQQMEVALSEARHAISNATEEDTKALQYQVDLVSACDRAYLTFMTAVAELQRQGKEREALNACLKALKLKPGDKPALFIAVNLYLKLDDTQSAIVMLRHSLRAHPDNVELLLLLGSVYQQAHDISAAEQVMARAIALQPTCYRDVLDFANYCLREGDVERALRQIDRVLEGCDDQQAEHELIDLLNGILGYDANCLPALERLVNLYTRAGITGRQIDALNSLAEAAMYKGEDEIAARALRWLIQLEPDEVWHHRMLRKISPQDESVQHLRDEEVETFVTPEQEVPQCAPQATSYSDYDLSVEIGFETVETVDAIEPTPSVDIEAGQPYFAHSTKTEITQAPAISSISEKQLDVVAGEAMEFEVGSYQVEPTSAVQAMLLSQNDLQPGDAMGDSSIKASPNASIEAGCAATIVDENQRQIEQATINQADEESEDQLVATKDVFISAGARRRRLLNQRIGPYTYRASTRKVGGHLPRRSW